MHKNKKKHKNAHKTHCNTQQMQIQYTGHKKNTSKFTKKTQQNTAILRKYTKQHKQSARKHENTQNHTKSTRKSTKNT